MYVYSRSKLYKKVVLLEKCDKMVNPNLYIITSNLVSMGDVLLDMIYYWTVPFENNGTRKLYLSSIVVPPLGYFIYFYFTSYT